MNYYYTRAGNFAISIGIGLIIGIVLAQIVLFIQ